MGAQQAHLPLDTAASPPPGFGNHCDVCIDEINLVLGSTYLLVAAFFFYRQRSLLAFYYGQICLSVSPYRGAVATTYKTPEDADSWMTWLHYRWAFAFVVLGFFEYGIAAGCTLVPTVAAWPKIITIYGPLVLAASVTTVHVAVISKYRDAESPWVEALSRRRR